MEGATTPFALSHAALLFWTVALPLVAAVLMMRGAYRAAWRSGSPPSASERP
jgi:hypothetical protein